MAWLIEFDESAIKDLSKFDKQAAHRITAFLRERLAPLDDPRSLGEALKGSKLGEFGIIEWVITGLLAISKTVSYESWLLK